MQWMATLLDVILVILLTCCGDKLYAAKFCRRSEVHLEIKVIFFIVDVSFYKPNVDLSITVFVQCGYCTTVWFPAILWAGVQTLCLVGGTDSQSELCKYNATQLLYVQVLCSMLFYYFQYLFVM